MEPQAQRSEAQRAAARVTPASSRSGLCANEYPEMLADLFNGLNAEFQPNTHAERLLIVQVAHARWHQFLAIENGQRRHRCPLQPPIPSRAQFPAQTQKNNEK